MRGSMRRSEEEQHDEAWISRCAGSVSDSGGR
jgi:hypothetical protein